MYTLKPLPFLYQDLEPYIDTHTMGLHHNKHEQNYVNNLNKLLEKNHFIFSYPIEEIYRHVDDFHEEDRNDLLFNLGGIVNHELYWQSINPKNKEKMADALLEAILNKYGSFDQFKEEFKKLALSIKGSGYTFLVKKQDGTIDIMNTINQDSPYLYGYMPLFNVDMWEHAYYLNYKNNKQEYLDNFFEIANFNYANKNYNFMIKM